MHPLKTLRNALPDTEEFSAYRSLEEKFDTYFMVKSSAGILDWDRLVKMPPQGATLRARQTAALDGIAHKILTGPEMQDLLAEAQSRETSLDPWQRANLRHMKRLYLHEAGLPQKMVEALGGIKVRCNAKWREAKACGDFRIVEDAFAEFIALQREASEARGRAMGIKPYDALIDRWDPWNTEENISKILAQLEKTLPPLLDDVIEKRKNRPSPLPLDCKFTEEKQLDFIRSILSAMGFSSQSGRLDTTFHPFSKGVAGDARIATRYDENDLMFPLIAAVHEAGHGLFDANAPGEWLGQPVGNSNNMGQTIHESQAIIFERVVARSPQFWTYVSAQAKDRLGTSGEAWSAKNLHALATAVGRSHIRVSADEISYPLHIILRYNIERDMLAGRIAIKDIPDAWNAQAQKLLGTSPGKDQSLGCLQDIHWYEGYYGYFHTYALGAILASQLFGIASKDIPGIEELFEKGHFDVLTSWLSDKIHRHGALQTPEERIISATGRPLDVAGYEAYLRRRYLG